MWLIMTLFFLATSFIAYSPAQAAESTPAHQAAAQKLTPSQKSHALWEVYRRFNKGEKISPALMRQFNEAQDENLATGPANGQHVPNFTLPDQNGKECSLKSLMGRNGLLLVFNRSTVW
ncbi:MAG: hypothetical protein ACREP6_09070 [Candidatus Binataceae bacterium]